jgi:phosphoribosylpyrophosphate synthetase
MRFRKAPHEYGASEALQGCGNPLFPRLRSDQRHFQRPSPKSKFLAIITTDSAPQASGDKVHVVSIAQLLGEAIRRIHQGQSVTSLFAV